MRTTLGRLVSIGAACSFAAACSTTKVDKVQKVAVDSDPPGALVFVNEGSSRRALGRTPMTVDQPWEAERHEANVACWLIPAVSAAGFAGGYKLFDGSGTNGGFEFVMGIELMVFGGLGTVFGVTGCVSSALQDGEEAPPVGFGADKKRLEVEAAGFVTQAIDVPMPGPDKSVTLVLPPLGGGLAAAVAMPPTSPLSASAPANAAPAALGGRPLALSGAGRPLVAGAAQPNAFALIVGIERYRDVPPPSGARADAERFAALAKTTLGVPERNVLLALDDRASRSDLEKHLRWLEKNVPAGGRVFLFFAGHGAPDGTSGSSYLLPYDADPADLPGTALRLSEVTARLGRTKARDVVAILDACFSGTGGRSVLAPGLRPLVPVTKLEAAPRVSVLAAVTGAQLSGAFPGGAEGLFSHFLGEALGEAKADLDGDGQISLKELHDWVKPRVEREAKRDSRDQVPSLTLGEGVDAAGTVLASGVTGG